jgi:redox-sensitive bicupin YhaK (pirin superfamily)
VQDTAIPSHCLAVLDPAAEVALTAIEESRLVIIGGQPLGKRIVWWNLVATRSELIEGAKTAWQAGRFAKIPGEPEFIPLPGG